VHVKYTTTITLSFSILTYKFVKYQRAREWCC